MANGAFFSNRDMALMRSFNQELLNDIVQCIVVIYKLSADLTKSNLYGESVVEGKWYVPGVDISCLIEHPDTSTQEEGFGPDRIKTVQFKFSEPMCRDANIYPEIGDLVFWDESYYEINNTTQEQHLGGQAVKSWSIIADSHLTKLSRINIQERQIG